MNTSSRLAPLSAVLFVLVSLTSGCAPKIQPVYNPQSAIDLRMGSPQYTPEQVHQAVLAGMALKGWAVLEDVQGYVVGQVTAGGHTAVSRIDYDGNGWRITLVSATPGLQHGVDRRNQQVVHRRYNNWAKLLDQAIGRALPSTASAQPSVIVIPNQ